MMLTGSVGREEKESREGGDGYGSARRLVVSRREEVGTGGDEEDIGEFVNHLNA